ncbi:unnamed protein product [Dibothriocephalus latus]|uniref:RRM domain-containing protein n=1 Tax=Dibothriocephalus latus TaxID=60516 RepID=A0A3P7RG78_DIBLA|nr:unnamed protein product [Dibothriocephalus latus]
MLQMGSIFHNAKTTTTKPNKPIELFVNGVKSDITANALRKHFAKFGEVLAVNMSINPSTNNHCGNGYIKLRPKGQVKCILDSEHVIRGIQINVEECDASDESSDAKATTAKPKKPIKLFVNGVKLEITENALRKHFAKFGEVLDVNMSINPSTNNHCGNGYIKLRPKGQVKSILDSEHVICGVQINVEECDSGDESG